MIESVNFQLLIGLTMLDPGTWKLPLVRIYQYHWIVLRGKCIIIAVIVKRAQCLVFFVTVVSFVLLLNHYQISRCVCLYSGLPMDKTQDMIGITASLSCKPEMSKFERSSLFCCRSLWSACASVSWCQVKQEMRELSHVAKRSLNRESLLEDVVMTMSNYSMLGGEAIYDATGAKPSPVRSGQQRCSCLQGLLRLLMLLQLAWALFDSC